MTTIDYYNTNATQLIDRYDNANMSSLHQLLLKHIPKNSSILDIGFGSGRDLQFLHDNGYDIWGIDPSAKFVENAKKRFPSQQNQFLEESVPFDRKDIGFPKDLDVVITIAIWMHLKHSKYKDVVESIVSVLKSQSTVVISYSQGSRANDERYFEEVDLDYITELFNVKGFTLVEMLTNNDSLDRDSLTWVTVVFKND
ncbi:methyltransferase domain-containing protein [Sulfurimonas aquatica]|uniref:Methyltransferase domain-containing protein n=2 Tax=Sulfurimonas aquatica TaxID=2672570 RepID=A0A975B2U6_9BACT|nr:methyltransferase domain-containing protein [Sulfurimonas aquatica]